jgi:hydrophobic/amphiphilic exporter-1 (mainly G- bacteria), HAE1 family
MNISKVFIKKPVMTTLFVITLTLFGIFAYLKMPVDSLPSVDIPIINVKTSYPGASPETVAETITSPLESQFMQISGLDNVISSSTEGFSNITLTFGLDIDINQVISDVQIAISKAKRYLPNDLTSDPSFKQSDPNAKPIMFIMISSDNLSHDQLYKLAEDRVSQPLSILNGVSEVTMRSVPAAVRIKLDPYKMAGYGITLDEVKSALNKENVSLSGGSLQGEYKTYSIIPKGQITSAEGYDNLIVKYSNGNPVRISDLGIAYESTENEKFNLTYYSKDGKKLINPIMLQVAKQEGANTVEIASQIEKIISNLQKSLPESVHTEIIYNSATEIIKSIDEVKMTLVMAFILVVLVIFFFMGKLRDTLIPAVVIPVSIVFTFIVMYLIDFSIDNLSLLAITLAIGFLVDDSIVVLENAARFISKGVPPVKAAIESVKEITGSVISTSFALIIVFVPIVFMGGIVGMVFREFALTVIIAIICSTIVSLTLTPMMNAKLLKKTPKYQKKHKILDFKDKCIDKVINSYSSVLRKFLKRYYFAAILWVVCIIGSLALYFAIPKTFLPNGDSGTIFGQLKIPLGISSVQAKKYQQEVNDVLKDDKNVSHFFTITGLSDGADQSTGVINIMLKPQDQRESIDEVVKGLRKKFGAMAFPLGNVYISPNPVLKIPTGGSNKQSGSQYSYTITGNSQKEIAECAAQLESKMKTMPEFQDVQSNLFMNMPQLVVDIDRVKAGKLGVSASDIASAFSLAFSRGEVTEFTKDNDTYSVIVQNSAETSEKYNDISKIYVKSSITGGLIPLIEVANITETVGAQSISHYQKMDSGTISFNISDGIPLEQATNAISQLSSTIFPTSVQGIFMGSAQQFIDAVASFGILILIAVFLKYVVLGILYESYLYPLTILTTLPTATIGGLGALYLFGSELSLYAYIGMFMLLGIVAKNGILMVDYAIQKMENDKMSALDAIHTACIVRFRPIAMTGLTSIMGAAPIAFGLGSDASIRQPLGFIVVGGLVVSQVITLFITPGIFLCLNAIKEKVYSGKSKRVKRARAKYAFPVKKESVVIARNKKLKLGTGN